MNGRQERMIAMSKGVYPGDLDKQLSFIEGYKFAKNDNFTFGIMLGMLIVTVLLVGALFAFTTSNSAKTSYPKADALLNSAEWKIDTLKTITNGRDTSTTYRFTKKDYDLIKKSY